MIFDDTKTVVTPEQVTVTYSLAGVGTRFAAVLLDTCIQAGAVAVVLLIIAGMGAAVPLERLDPLRLAEPWLAALVVIAVFALLWGYFIFWESVWNGQTPGKRAAGIRVMRDGGHPVDFRAVFVRNVVRYVDFLPALYGIGAFTMFLSKDSKRLGDYAAGTIVVADSRPLRSAARSPSATAVAAEGQAAQGSPAPVVKGSTRQQAGAAPFDSAQGEQGWPTPPTYALLGDPALLNLRAMTREQFGVVDRFLARRIELSPKVRREMARKIALPLMPLIGLTPPADDSYPFDAFLAELAAAYRARAGS
jgi:uncharacterized RDD family membrane protein YckC